MQVDPQAQQPSVLITTSAGGVALDPGRQVVARVLEVNTDGGARISLAGQTLTVQSDLPLAAGDTLSLTVGTPQNGQVRLTVNGSTPPPAAALPQDASPTLETFAPSAIRELARAGIAVTPQLAQAAAKAVEQLAPSLGSADGAARAIAELIARGAAVTPATAGRVAAALDLAGQLGPQLRSLAAASPEIAAALPDGPPSTAALRGVLTPGLSRTELALARVAQATIATQIGTSASAANAPLTAPPTSSPSVAANYVASQVAAATSLEDLARASGAIGQQAATGTSAGGNPAATGPAGLPVTPGTKEAALASKQPTAANTAASSPQPAPPALATAAAARGADPAATARPATASAATTATAATTPPPVAEAVAQLATAVIRLAPGTAAREGGLTGSATGVAAQPNTTPAQAAAASGQASQAGAAASGGAAPLVTSIRDALALLHTRPEEARTLLLQLSRADAGRLAGALQQLPEAQTLQFAGALLEAASVRAGEQPGSADARMRLAVHNALDDLGRALGHSTSIDEHTLLRAALEHVAANDPRPAVAEQASRLLQGLDGQQLVSQQRHGADPGFVYFQVPLPGQRQAEVLVRREPGRRQVTFDTFEIAFLLETESLGSLMIHLDAHPAALRATVKTEFPALEPFLAIQAEELKGLIEPEARRPVLVTTGVFENGTPPPSLLEPSLGLIPGANDYYA